MADPAPLSPLPFTKDSSCPLTVWQAPRCGPRSRPHSFIKHTAPPLFVLLSSHICRVVLGVALCNVCPHCSGHTLVTFC
jgi:hypothetical protein